MQIVGFTLCPNQQRRHNTQFLSMLKDKNAEGHIKIKAKLSSAASSLYLFFNTSYTWETIIPFIFMAFRKHLQVAHFLCLSL